MKQKDLLTIIMVILIKMTIILINKVGNNITSRSAHAVSIIFESFTFVLIIFNDPLRVSRFVYLHSLSGPKPSL